MSNLVFYIIASFSRKGNMDFRKNPRRPQPPPWAGGFSYILYEKHDFLNNSIDIIYEK